MKKQIIIGFQSVGNRQSIQGANLYGIPGKTLLSGPSLHD